MGVAWWMKASRGLSGPSYRTVDKLQEVQSCVVEPFVFYMVSEGQVERTNGWYRNGRGVGIVDEG